MEITRIHTGRFSNLVRGSLEDMEQRMKENERSMFVHLESPEGTRFIMNREAISRVEQLPGEFSSLPRHD